VLSALWNGLGFCYKSFLFKFSIWIMSRYYLRFMDPENSKELVDKAKERLVISNL